MSIILPAFAGSINISYYVFIGQLTFRKVVSKMNGTFQSIITKVAIVLKFLIIVCCLFNLYATRYIFSILIIVLLLILSSVFDTCFALTWILDGYVVHRK